MKASEQLKQELANTIPFTKEEFIKSICERIRVCGQASFVCDKHIGRTELEHGASCKLAHENIFKEWAHSEGFEWHYDYNSYGVRYIIFTL